jgi:hyperosmotically inducible protein
MFRALFKLLILLIVLVAVGGYFLGWWGADLSIPNRDTVGTAGQAISQKTAEAAKVAQEALSDGGLTAKIKAKMALDDTIKASDLNVDTVNGVVTVTGNVRTRGERDRALALARETNGVREVVDRIRLQ